MAWCERCGRFFLLGSNRTVRRVIGARGPVGDVVETVCINCLTPTERYDEGWSVVDSRNG